MHSAVCKNTIDQLVMVLVLFRSLPELIRGFLLPLAAHRILFSILSFYYVVNS